MPGYTILFAMPKFRWYNKNFNKVWLVQTYVTFAFSTMSLASMSMFNLLASQLVEVLYNDACSNIFCTLYGRIHEMFSIS